MKARIQDEGFRELSTNCRQLKMRAIDGKLHPTDARRIYAQAPITIVKNA